jgi:hypothetical protein
LVLLSLQRLVVAIEQGVILVLIFSLRLSLLGLNVLDLARSQLHLVVGEGTLIGTVLLGCLLLLG